jgi:AcrR family transcriptional regulator
MSEGELDRRVRRTRRALRAAVVELVADKGYQAVTVDHICERADVTRATFYAHFRDKEHLLSSVADDLVDTCLDAFEAAGGVDRGAERLVVLFEHARAEDTAFRLVLRGEGDGAALRRVRERLTTIVAETLDEHRRLLGTAPVVPLEVLTRMVVGEIVAVLGWWLDDAGDVDARTAVGWLRATGLYGRLWALGADERSLSRPAAAAFRAGLPSKEHP